jgi:glucokinase
MMKDEILLAGDIGGTKSNLAFYSSKDGFNNPIAEDTLQNKDYKNFEGLIKNFLEANPQDFVGMCLGIAGPVVENRVQPTHLPWLIDGAILKDKFNLKEVWLLNDLKALSYAIPILPPEDLEILNEGKPVEKAPIAVIAPGTGLGEAFLTWDGKKYQANSSEGGHTDFAPVNERQVQLLLYLLKKQERVSYEDVCSGIGVINLYHFLRDEGYAPEPEWLIEDISGVDDITPIIFEAAQNQDRHSPLCEMAIELFAETLGTEAGNLGLRTMAEGGIYIGGGLPPRILPQLRTEVFLNAVINKPPLTELLAKFPVKVILNPKANLIGAAKYGLDSLA